MKLGRYSKASIITSAIIGLLLIIVALFMLRFELIIRADGLVLPLHDTHLFAPDDTVIRRLHIEPGQVVKVGDSLIELDNPEVRARMLGLDRDRLRLAAEQARIDWTLQAWRIRPGDAAEVTAAQRAPLLARVVEIQRDMAELFSQMEEQQIVSQVDVNLREVERIRAELDLIQTSAQETWETAGLSSIEEKKLTDEKQQLDEQLALIEKERNRLNEQMERWTLRAPTDGQVIGLPHRFEGEAVQRGALLVRIAPVDGPRLVRVYAPPRNIDLLHPGTRALIISTVYDSFLEGYAHGTVLRISPEGQTSPTSERRYEVDILIDDSPYPLVYDSPAEARLLLGKRAISDIFLKSAGQSRQRDSTPQTP